MPTFFRRSDPAQIRTPSLHHVSNLSVFALVQPKPSIARTGFDFKVVAPVPESNHFFTTVRAKVINYPFAVLPLAFDNIVVSCVVFERFECCGRNPDAITPVALSRFLARCFRNMEVSLIYWACKLWQNDRSFENMKRYSIVRIAAWVCFLDVISIVSSDQALSMVLNHRMNI